MTVGSTNGQNTNVRFPPIADIRSVNGGAAGFRLSAL
jgi:hypothetical protein